MGTIGLENIRKEFSQAGKSAIVAVDDVSLFVEEGEFIVLVGPSGSGKSTLLRLIAGLEDLTDGTITIGGEDISTTKPKNRDIAMVFQSYALYPHLSVRGNISFGLKMQGDLSNEEIGVRVEDAADILDIPELLDKMPDELSGGQKQRVALGRAIVRKPKAFLMDEPLSNLDAKLRTIMRTEIQQLQKELDVTTVYVTHDQTEAMTMGDRIAIMDRGEIQQVATPLEAYYEPANQFVAGFIGSPSMNFLEVSIQETTDGLQMSHSGFTFDVPSTLQDELLGYDELVLGIRPEDIVLADEGEQNVIEVDIKVIEPLGKDQLVYFELGGETYKASVEGRLNIPEASSIQFSIPNQMIHIFEKESGKTIKNADAAVDNEAFQSNFIGQESVQRTQSG